MNRRLKTSLWTALRNALFLDRKNLIGMNPDLFGHHAFSLADANDVNG